MRRRIDNFGRFLPNSPPHSNSRESSKQGGSISTSHIVKDEPKVKVEQDTPYIDL